MRRLPILRIIVCPMSTSRSAWVALATVILVLTACSGSDDPGTAGQNDASSTTAPPAGEPTATSVPEPAATGPRPATSSPETTAPSPASTEPPPETTPPVRDTEALAAIAPVVEEFVAERGLNGAGLIVVDEHDGVVYHDHWGEFSEDRVSLVASSSKMIVAGVLMRLHDDGLLDIDAPVADVVEWGAGNPDITPAQLLSNSSGLIGLLQNPGYGPYICQFMADGSLQDCAASIFTTPDDDADIIAPDTDFNYGGAQWQVAGAIAEVASGKPWEQLIEEIYVTPCELDALGFNNHFSQIATEGFRYPRTFDGDPSVLADTDNPNIEGGAYVTTGDYGKLLLMHLRGGVCGDEQVLSAESLARMHTDRIGDVYGGDAYRPGSGYGMGWWVGRQTGYISDGGAYGSVPWLDLDDGYGAFLVIEADSTTGNELAAQLQPIIDEALSTG